MREVGGWWAWSCQVGLSLPTQPSLYFQNLTDAIARAAADTLQGPMQAAYREAFQSVVLPAFEKSCQAMFQQINESFRLGTQECGWGPMPLGGRSCPALPSQPSHGPCGHPSDLQQLESHMKSRKAREQEAREPVLAQLRGLVSTLQGATEQMAATVSSSVRAEVQHQLHVAVGRCVGRILGKVLGLESARPDFLSTSSPSLPFAACRSPF